MHLVSIQVGKVQSREDGWTTAYYKSPVDGQVWVGQLNIEGDEQQYKKYHGGAYRPILAYSAEHYPLWNQELDIPLPYGAFAENFTISGLNENTACLGDIYQIGNTVKVQISQPRIPCDNISRRWGIDTLTQQVKNTGRTGWYMQVLQEGYISAGLPIQRIAQPYPNWTVTEVHSIYQGRTRRQDEAYKLAQCEALEPGWRKRLLKASER